MKVGIVYTSTTPELIEMMNGLVKEILGDAEVYEQRDPSILADVREAGYVTAKPAARLIRMYMNAVEEGCDAILNVCSSVGEVADCAQDAAAYLGVPIVRIDLEMCREAVRAAAESGGKIAVMGTLATTMEPTMRTVERMARSMGRHAEIIPCLVEGAFGLDQDAFKARMGEAADSVAGEACVIVFAQGSMAYCEEYIAERTGRCVLSSPRSGVLALRKALAEKGVLDA